jgi:intracellular multiplication protein IcmB
VGIVDGIGGVAADILMGLGSVFRVGGNSYIELETCEDDLKTLVRPDGTLSTLVRLDGVQKVLGPHEMPDFLAGIESQFNSIVSRPGFSIDIVVQRDPDMIKRTIEAALAPARATAERLGLDAGWILDSRRDALMSYCASETVWLVLNTNYERFTRVEIKRANKERNEKGRTLPHGKYSQNMTPSASNLYSAHTAMVSELREGLANYNVLTRELTAHEALLEMRLCLDPGSTSFKWRALLPGDPLPTRMPDTGSEDATQTLYPRIRDQLMPKGAGEIVNHRWIEVGDRLHAPCVMSLPPQTPRPFQALFGSLINADIPFRILFSLTPDGVNGFGFKSILTSVLHITSSANKQFNAALDTLRKRALSGETVVGFRMVANTWAPSDQPDLLRQRASQLEQSIQSWGSSDTRNIFGDPLLGVTASVPGLSRMNPAPAAAAPLESVIPMLPLTRPASPWDHGAMLFRTPDGKLMPFQPGSSLQSAHVTLGFAPMGQGKSVLLNAQNFSTALRAGIDKLPYMSILDIGPSSSGLISLLQHSLPESKRYLAQYHRLQMTPEYAINPFDTPLGLKKPLPDHRAMLTNLLIALSTEAGVTQVESGISGICTAVVDLVYDIYSPQRTPKRYDPNQDPQLAETIKRQDIPIDNATTWWEVVDEFFDRGLYEDASRAQRFAVPLLGDCASAVRDESITTVYKGTTRSNESMTDYVWRMISEALNMFPILAQPTRFDLGNARVVSLDLDEVCPKGSAQADRQTGIMYMLGRYVLAERYYFGKKSVPAFEEKYRPYHLERAAEIASELKVLSMDEFHRTEGAPAVRAQVVRDIREGRKWGIAVTLVSQNVDDFDDVMRDLSLTRFALGANTRSDAEKVVKRFALTPSAVDIIYNRINKPGRKGAGCYFSAATSRGNNEMFVYMTLGAAEMWAFDSTAENRALRDLLYERLGAKRAIELLVQHFPNGSAVEVIERRRDEMDSDTDIQGRSIIETLAEEMLATA